MDNKAKILDIAMNLNRIGNMAADNFEMKRKRIDMFMRQTADYIKSIDGANLKEPFKSTFDNFLKEYKSLNDLDNNSDRLLWAEKMMTWGNILTHRAKLI